MSDQPMENLPAFQNQISDTYTSTHMATYKNPAFKDKLLTDIFPKAPLCSEFMLEPGFKAKPNASKWGSTSNATYGVHSVSSTVERAEARMASLMMDSAALEEPMQTADPFPDCTTSAYYHAPMPDAAITQHFLARKTTSAVIDGSGTDQLVDVPSDGCEPGFYYLRDGDGTRRVLEVRCPNNPVALRAQGRGHDERAKELRTAGFAPALTYSGLTSSYRSVYSDPQGKADAIAMRADDLGRERQADNQMAFGETKRICVPHFFKHEMGVPTTDRHVELKMRNRPRDPNPPRAAISTADTIIYNSASDALR